MGRFYGVKRKGDLYLTWKPKRQSVNTPDSTGPLPPNDPQKVMISKIDRKIWIPKWKIMVIDSVTKYNLGQTPPLLVSYHTIMFDSNDLLNWLWDIFFDRYSPRIESYVHRAAGLYPKNLARFCASVSNVVSKARVIIPYPCPTHQIFLQELSNGFFIEKEIWGTVLYCS